jgi:hypothetical protein
LQSCGNSMADDGHRLYHWSQHLSLSRLGKTRRRDGRRLQSLHPSKHNLVSCKWFTLTFRFSDGLRTNLASRRELVNTTQRRRPGPIVASARCFEYAATPIQSNSVLDKTIADVVVIIDGVLLFQLLLRIHQHPEWQQRSERYQVEGQQIVSTRR